MVVYWGNMWCRRMDEVMNLGDSVVDECVGGMGGGEGRGGERVGGGSSSSGGGGGGGKECMYVCM